jgi:hypothetical protein
MDDDEQMELALNSNFDSELFDCWDDGDVNVSNSNNGDGRDGKRALSSSGMQQLDVAGPRRGRRRGSANRGGAGDNDNEADEDGELDRCDDAGGETRVADDSCWDSPEAFEHFSRLPSFSMDNNDYDGRRTDLDGNDAAAPASESAEPSLLPSPPTKTNKASSRPKKNRTTQQQRQLAAADGDVAGPAPSAVVSSYSSIASTSASRSSGPGQSTLSADSSYSAVPQSSDASAARPSMLAPPSGPGAHDAATQMHPLGTLSSAKCPPLPASGAASNNHHHHGLPASAAAIPADLQGAAFYPLALSALAAGAAAAAAANATMNNQYLIDAVNNANNHAVAAAAVAAILGNPHQSDQQQQQLSQRAQRSSGSLDSANAEGISTQQQRMPPSEAASMGHPGATAGSSGRGTPVVSFDTAAAAPIELRTNFENSLRAHGMLDANSVPYSFGVSVNGFHPQQGMMGSASSSVTGDTSAAASRLGAGLGGAGEKRLKNAKEQVRAQKIAELIDELREKMQKSGWSVGVSKSKYNTLSSYVEAA